MDSSSFQNEFGVTADVFKYRLASGCLLIVVESTLVVAIMSVLEKNKTPFITALGVLAYYLICLPLLN